MKIGKKELIEIVSENAKVSFKDAENVIVETFEAIRKAMINDNEVNIKNFGVFVPKIKKSRIGTDPSSHKKIELKEKKTVTLRVSNSFKDDLNR